MEFNLESGLMGEVEKYVRRDMLADEFGSGDIKVLATPVMIGFMEHASLKAVDCHLPEGMATVGYNINVDHLAPTPPNIKVVTKARLNKIKGRKLEFKVWSLDEVEKIGQGTHVRYIVDVKKLQQKAAKKGT